MATLDELTRLVSEHEAAFAQALAEVDASPPAGRAAAIEALTIGWTGRKSGRLANLMGHLPSLPPADRRAFGQLVNALKSRVEQALTEREMAAAATRRPAGAVDVTLPGRAPALGHRHPLSLVREEVQAIFTRFGYQVLEGPEIEDDYHNFEALNMPEEHPARDMQDTLYLAAPLHPPPSPAPAAAESARSHRRPGAPQPLTLLRTHTSAMQIRHMEQHDPPVRLVAIGPVYRRDNLDLTHTPMFHQCEGLVVGAGITLAHLKGTLLAMAAALFGAGTPVRFRPSFSPYTEPSAEVDIGCIRCGGVGCPVCKHTGWVEELPRQRHGASGGVRGRRLRPGAGDRLCLRHGHRARRHAQVGRRRHPPVLRERSALPRTVLAMKILYSWLRDFVDVSDGPAELGQRMSLRGLALEGLEPAPEGDGPPGVPPVAGDAVLDFDVTANRPDCLSIVGVAREVATVYGLPLRLPSAETGHLAAAALAPAGRDVFTVRIEAPDLCPRYVGAAADVRVAPSPAWLQRRLMAQGVRPISNVVDITNYVLLELGQPMHAFDHARLAEAAIVVRRAAPGERLTTLDGKARTLAPDMLVIADAVRATGSRWRDGRGRQRGR